MSRESKINRLIRSFEEQNHSGKTVIVTGANSGIGYEAARMLSKMGMTVVLACRSLEKGNNALAKIKSENPDASLELIQLDLSSQSSVKEFAEKINSKLENIDILVNNAGLMATPYSLTEDGFEMQFGTNHLGHFTLTALILSKIINTKGSRIVTISSIAHFNGSINFEDLKSEKSYSGMVAYRQSKLANLLFSYELDRKLKESGKDCIAVAVHPGITSTNILELPPFLVRLKEMILMSTAKGALPTIIGAVDPELKGGEYIGPDGIRQMFGFPKILKSGDHSYDRELSSRLWKVSEELTGIKYNFK